MKLDELKDTRDIVKIDVPLFIRMLEYAREDAKSDKDLHDLASKVIALKDRVLTMADYDVLFAK